MFAEFASSRSTVRSRSAALGWVYRALFSSRSWPSNVATVTRSTPASSACRAKLCRKVRGVTSVNPASRAYRRMRLSTPPLPSRSPPLAD
jgi:hypothetical protein